MDDLSSRFRRSHHLRRRRSLCGLSRCAQSDGEDYLSGLPDELLRYILSFLPTRDSVRTSVLASRWRRVWASVPAIDFSYIDVLKGIIIDRFIASRSVSDSISRLRLSGLSLQPGDLLSELLDYAKSHGVKHVTLLRLYFRESSFRNLRILFDWPSLVSLNLQTVHCDDFCRFSLPSCIINCIVLSNLKTLSLDVGKATIHNECLQRLLSACPVLEELTLKAKYHSKELIQIATTPNLLLRLTLLPTPSMLRIACPKLECLRLNYRDSLKHLHVEAPSLTSLQFCELWYFGRFAQIFCNRSFRTDC